MNIICSYCRKHMGEKPPLDDPAHTHTICPPCYADFEKQWAEQQTLHEYLNTFDAPVMVLTGEGRITAVNDRLVETTGLPREHFRAYLGGEAFECAHACLPEGCGHTIHCKTCTLRNTVEATLQAGQPQEKIPATVTRQGDEVQMLISTSLQDGVVHVVIDEMTVVSPALTLPTNQPCPEGRC